jgi:hypothetical protein
MRKSTLYICLIALLGFSSACQDQKKHHSFELKDVAMFAEGPLFEGSNTVQAELNAPLEQFLKDHQISMDQISRITLKNAGISAGDSSDFKLFQSITLQLASENSDMMQIAVLNPIPQNERQAVLKVAGEQDKLSDILKQKQIFLVGDVLIGSDAAANIDFKCSLTFDIESK